jgi:hypothetical protein
MLERCWKDAGLRQMLDLELGAAQTTSRCEVISGPTKNCPRRTRALEHCKHHQSMVGLPRLRVLWV